MSSSRVERIGDMGQGTKLSVTKDSQGDVHIAVMPEGHMIPQHRLEFCNSGTRSPRTVKALQQLYQAMQLDAEERPEGNPKPSKTRI